MEGILYVNGTGPTPITHSSTSVSATVNLIQGDITCDGQVNILDLSTVAGFYDRTSADPEWNTIISKYNLKADSIIDIYDLVLIANKLFYGHTDTKP